MGEIDVQDKQNERLALYDKEQQLKARFTEAHSAELITLLKQRRQILGPVYTTIDRAGIVTQNQLLQDAIVAITEAGGRVSEGALQDVLNVDSAALHAVLDHLCEVHKMPQHDTAQHSSPHNHNAIRQQGTGKVGTPLQSTSIDTSAMDTSAMDNSPNPSQLHNLTSPDTQPIVATDASQPTTQIADPSVVVHHEHKTVLSASFEKDQQYTRVCGDVIHHNYYVNLCKEVVDMLSMSGVCNIATLARSVQLPTNVLLPPVLHLLHTTHSVPLTRHGNMLYSTGYQARQKGALLGALRARVRPVALADVAARAGLAIDVATIADEWVQQGLNNNKLQGMLRGGVWVPGVYLSYKQEQLRAYFSANKYVTRQQVTSSYCPWSDEWATNMFPGGIVTCGAICDASWNDVLQGDLQAAEQDRTWLDARDTLPCQLGHADVSYFIEKSSFNTTNSSHITSYTKWRDAIGHGHLEGGGRVGGGGGGGVGWLGVKHPD